MHVLITGGRGFLGGAFASFLEKKGIPRTFYDRARPDDIPEEIDMVVHFAGATSASTLKQFREANVVATKRLLVALAGHKKLTRFVHIGSAAEYGFHSSLIRETTRPSALSAYGRSKREQGALVEKFARAHKVKTIHLRLFNIVGMPKQTRETPRNVFENLARQFSGDFSGVISVWNAGDVRDYVDVDDVMEAVFAATQTKKGGIYEVINIASGRGTKLKDIVVRVGAHFGLDYRIKNTKRTPTRAVGSPQKAKHLLGWQAHTPLVESMAKLFGGRTKVLVVGAGVAGQDVVEALRKEGRTDIVLVGFVDDDVTKHETIVSGVRVLGAIADMPRIVLKRGIDQVLISTPSVGSDVVARVTRLLRPGFPIKVLPSVSSVLLDSFDFSSVRDIDVSDLVGRPLVKSDQQFIAKKVRGKTFLVTGGAGSIGSEIVRHLHAAGARTIIVLDAWEEGVFNLLGEFRGKKTPLAYIANIRDKVRLAEIFTKHNINAVFHAAAYKHVPLMEGNPDEAQKTNVQGTQNVLDLVVQHRIPDFVLISTDKAVHPVSVMGKTKRAAELLVKKYAKKHPGQRFASVRFGNVLNSSGSVIPTFLRQIHARQPVTITHRDMTRYFMAIPEAVSLVLQSWIVAKNGQILLLDMGSPVKILDLALTLIKLHGLEPYRDISIEEIGTRPGEKMHEELSYKKGMMKPSPLPRIFIAEDI